MLKKQSILATIAFSLFLVSFALRVAGLNELAPQADELHWQHRSYKIIKNYQAGEYSHLTTHLGQPGIPAALTIAAGELLADKYNIRFSLNPGETGYVDQLYAGRLSLSILNSFLSPILFLFLCTLGPVSFAFFTSLFLAFDPQNIAHSRLQHLDAILAIFVIATAFCWYHAVQKKNVYLKLLAGLFWGLSIAVKPTAGALLLGFVLFKVLRRFTVEADLDTAERGIITWSDLLAFVLGHVLFASIYTRTWHRPIDYVARMRIPNTITEPLFQYSTWFSFHPIATLVVFLSIVLVAGLFWTRFPSKNTFYFGLTFSLGFLSIRFFPTVWENLILYWTWALGLAAEQHHAFGVVWEPPPYGYAGLILSRHPDLVGIGILVSLVVGLIYFLKKQQDKIGSFSIFSGVLVFVWILLLSVSGKQSLRYIQPVVPLLYIFSFWGLFQLYSWVQGRNSVFAKASLLALFGLYAWDYYKWFPYQELYCNRISGGLAAAKLRNSPIPFTGQNESLRFLQQEAEHLKRDNKVYVSGDLDSLKTAYRRMKKVGPQRVSFEYSNQPKGGYYFLTSSFFSKKFVDQSLLKDAKKVFEFRPQGVALTTLYLPPLPDFSSMRRIQVLDLPRKSGRGRYYSLNKKEFLEKKKAKGKGLKVLYATKEHKDRKGYIYYGETIRFPKGKYFYELNVALGPEIKTNTDLTGDEPVLKIIFGKCEKLLRFSDLSVGEFKDFRVKCEFEENEGAHLKSYWFGSHPVMVHGLELGKIVDG